MIDDDMGSTPSLDAFDRQLLVHLRGEIQERGRRRRSWRRRALAGAGALAATVAAAVTLSSGSPAFAIEQSADGGVVLTINRLEEAGDVAEGLAEQGIRAQVIYDARSPGRSCAGPRGAAAFTTKVDDDVLVLRIAPESVLTTGAAELQIVATQGDLESVRVGYTVAGVPCAANPAGPAIEPPSPGNPATTPTPQPGTGPGPDGPDPGGTPQPTTPTDAPSPTARPTPPTPGESSLEVTFTTTSEWDAGYVGQFTIRNPTDSPVTGWRLTFDLPETVEIVQHWNADLARAGTQVTATGVTGTHTIPAGSFVTVGFETTGTGRPTGCRIDGATC